MDLIRFIVAILIPVLSGTLGGFLTAPNLGWYALLNRPTLTPPSWVFAPVWTTLYLLMGIASYLIWQEKPSKKRANALTLYFIQLGLNLSWSYFFFAQKLPPLALVVIFILWLAIILTIIKFYRLNKTAGYILIPYLIWVTFATYLNFEVVRLNPF